MKKQLTLLAALAISLNVTALAQEQADTAAAAASQAAMPASWTLKACIDYAKEHNVSVRKNRVSVERAGYDLDDAKKAWLPDVNFSSTQQLSYRPFEESSVTVDGTKMYSNSHKLTYSGSYGVSANMPLYDGGVIKNNVKMQQIASQIARLGVEASELSVEEQITQYYVQILYAREQVKQDEEQIALSETQLGRARALFESGLLNKADVSQLESQLANDKYQKVADETTLADYKLQLKQLLELTDYEAFDIPETSLSGDVMDQLPTKADVFANALLNRPEVRANQLAIDQADVNVAIAKAGMSPTVSLSGSIGTNNNSNGGNFFTQLKDNWSNAIGVTVSVPLWDHGKTKNAIAKARLDKETSYLDLLETQKNLWRTIETYWLNAHNAQARYVAAQEKVSYARTSYELTSEQFRLGLKNIIELMTDKTNLSSSIQQMLQAKYTQVMNAALLKYYNGEQIQL